MFLNFPVLEHFRVPLLKSFENFKKQRQPLFGFFLKEINYGKSETKTS